MNYINYQIKRLVKFMTELNKFIQRHYRILIQESTEHYNQKKIQLNRANQKCFTDPLINKKVAT